MVWEVVQVGRNPSQWADWPPRWLLPKWHRFVPWVPVVILGESEEPFRSLLALLGTEAQAEARPLNSVKLHMFQARVSGECDRVLSLDVILHKPNHLASDIHMHVRTCSLCSSTCQVDTSYTKSSFDCHAKFLKSIALKICHLFGICPLCLSLWKASPLLWKAWRFVVMVATIWVVAVRRLPNRLDAG